jgi:hypothetical protein
VFRTPLSWLLALQQLRARLELPAGLAIELDVRDGRLSASGSLFGTSPVELPLAMPDPASAHDAREEIAVLLATGKDVAERLVAKRAQDWIWSQLTSP